MENHNRGVHNRGQLPRVPRGFQGVRGQAYYRGHRGQRGQRGHRGYRGYRGFLPIRQNPSRVPVVFRPPANIPQHHQPFRKMTHIEVFKTAAFLLYFRPDDHVGLLVQFLKCLFGNGIEQFVYIDELLYNPLFFAPHIVLNNPLRLPSGQKTFRQQHVVELLFIRSRNMDISNLTIERDLAREIFEGDEVRTDVIEQVNNFYRFGTPYQMDLYELEKVILSLRPYYCTETDA
ncbi:unnamed protein product [Caenorhabditis bovis]|uniref:Uncharacterized protein n=1 Tax=Caenorhabditis bovis TaxID=2654633 RepID=A0A8S1F8B0_9PELO|nr:unnamed protein product [Caenorhabditis bovis]